jgi:hypothetical protein
VDGPPHRKWTMAPFNDAWPNSIFMLLDGVAIDSVGFDLLTSEWPSLLDIGNADNYVPRVPGLRRVDWPLKDPKGSPMEEVRVIRDDIKNRVLTLLSDEKCAL